MQRKLTTGNARPRATTCSGVKLALPAKKDYCAVASLGAALSGPDFGAAILQGSATASRLRDGQAGQHNVSPAGCSPGPTVLRITGALSFKEGSHRTVVELLFEAGARDCRNLRREPKTLELEA